MAFIPNLVLVCSLATSFAACSEQPPELHALRTETFIVEPDWVDCVGLMPMKCLVVNGEYFYDQIDGFTYEEGYRYTLRVLVEPLPAQRVPADGSAVTYQLLELVDKVAVL